MTEKGTKQGGKVIAKWSRGEIYGLLRRIILNE